MFRAGLRLLHRVIYAALLLVLLLCGAEVGVRIYEVTTGKTIGSHSEASPSDPARLSVPCWRCYQILKPQSTAKVTSRDSGDVVEVRTNSLGLRGPEPSLFKPDDVCRIIVLGDETILAPEIPEDEHFCALLQRELQQHTRIRVEVINAGIPGHCPLSEYLLFKQHLMNLKPDLVLLHFDWSDVYDDRQMRRHARCDESGVPQSCPHPSLSVSKKFKACEVWRQHFRLLDLTMGQLSVEWKQQLARQKATSREVDTNPYLWLRNEHPENDVSFDLAVRPIAALADLCRATHCSFALMTSPKPWQASAKCSRGPGVRLAAGVAREACYSNRAPFNVLAATAERDKIPFIDASSVLANGQDVEANYLKHAPRWSAQGHRLTAELVAQFLMENVSGAWNSPYFQSDEQPAAYQATEAPAIQWIHGESPPQKQSSGRFPNR